MLTSDPLEQFRDAIRAAGLEPPDHINPGKLHRFPGAGKRNGDDAGWCRLFADGLGGVFGDWSSGLSGHWMAGRSGEDFTAEELAEFRRQVEQARKERQAEEAKRRKDAACKAGELVKAAAPAAADHPYLVRKNIEPVPALLELPLDRVKAILGYAPASRGEVLAGRILIAPITVEGELSTCELIDEQGRKSAIAGGRKAGGCWTPEPIPDDAETIAIGEGIATVLSVRQATGWPVLAALSSGNLEAVARQMQERHPAAALVILADLVKATGRPDDHAAAAARAVGGVLAVPQFGPDRQAGHTDFNDMATACGLEYVRTLLNSAVSAVSAVQATDGAVSSRYGSESTAVSAVSETADGEAKPPIPDEYERPKFIVLDDWTEHGGRKYRPGVWRFDVKAGKNDGPVTLTETWICSPLHVEAITHDAQDGNFGQLLRFKNTLGRWREWAMPMELLRGSGEELRGELLAMGVRIDPSSHRLLGQYLQAVTPKRRVTCALQTGWSGSSFVLPDTVIGPAASGVIFQSGERGHDEYTTAGTLDGWQAEIAGRAAGNPLLVLALSAAFAGPLLAKCNAESGGLHFVGDSSTGKTTLLEAACSVWGGPNYRRSWRATANGMEGAAALFNDGLLALDEISECDPREVGAIVYALGNGRGKQRASRSGSARGVVRWRCLVMSSGERTIGTTMAEGGHRAKAGQGVRLLDVPAARAFGCFDALHGFESGAALSDAIKRAAASCHGHAGRAFLERLTRDTRDFCAFHERLKALPIWGDPGEGQDKRAAARFALLALAGELAREYGIVPFALGDATKAAAEGFRLWRSARGRGNDERRQVLEQISAFIDRHGDGRFSSADGGNDPLIRDRAGWWKDGPGGRVFLFTADGLREALKGFDFKRALDVLEQAGALPAAGANGERARFHRINGRGVKLYPVAVEALEGGAHDP
jgi:putative DNA primase/helicase